MIGKIVRTTILGSGMYGIRLFVSEDAYLGDAQYTVSIDGKQVGGVLTAIASHGAGEDETVILRNAGFSGPHTVTVNFLNDVYGGSPQADRNLYVDGIAVDVATESDTSTVLGVSGPVDFGFTGYGPGGAAFGSGPDQLLLSISQDAYLGGALYTLTVDGRSYGTLKASALHGLGQGDLVTVRGVFAPLQQHTVTVDFLNDAYGGSPQLDRNLYVDSILLNGAQQLARGVVLGVPGPVSFSVPGYGNTSQSVGSGPDTYIVSVSQDAYLGLAQFTVSVDGQQIGGVLNSYALHGLGQEDTVSVSGNFGVGNHVVTVGFLEDAYGGYPQADRNLYVDSVISNGVVVPGSSGELNRAGDFSVGAPVTAPGQYTFGTGQDVLVLRISQDAYQGDAQYSIAVNGQNYGPLAATALHSRGQADSVTIFGNFSSSGSQVTVNFLNDAYGGSAQLDRNLYVEGITLNNIDQPQVPAVLGTTGAQAFTLQVSPPKATAIGTGADVLVLRVAQDAYLGSAQFTLALDGQQIGGVMTAAAMHTDNQDDTITLLGNFGTGPHVFTVNFLDDAYGGTPLTDRNLYVDSITFDGVLQPGAPVTLGSAGPRDFAVSAPGVVSSGVTTLSNQTAPGTLTFGGADKASQPVLNLASSTLGGLAMPSALPLSPYTVQTTPEYATVNASGASAIGSIAIGAYAGLVRAPGPYGHPPLTVPDFLTVNIADGSSLATSFNVKAGSTLTVTGGTGASLDAGTSTLEGGIAVIDTALAGAGTIVMTVGAASSSSGQYLTGALTLNGSVGAGETIDVGFGSLVIGQPAQFLGTIDLSAKYPPGAFSASSSRSVLLRNLVASAYRFDDPSHVMTLLNNGTVVDQVQFSPSTTAAVFLAGDLVLSQTAAGVAMTIYPQPQSTPIPLIT